MELDASVHHCHCRRQSGHAAYCKAVPITTISHNVTPPLLPLYREVKHNRRLCLRIRNVDSNISLAAIQWMIIKYYLIN
jgi:hypothetical protein